MKGNRLEIDNEAIITTDEIKLILDRYRIGKKPLAKLLGWGETTIIRYMEGDTPTNEYSNKLKAILDDPEFYYDILLKRRDSLTGVAFKKSKKAVLSKIMASKIYAVAYYIVNKTNADICPGYVQYLLYYIQAFSLALQDKELFNEDCIVTSYHTPYLKLYDAMRRCGVHTLEVNEDYLSEDERELVDTVFESFTWYGPRALSAMVAQEKSMIKVSRDKYNNKVITKEALKSYFKEILNQYQIQSVKDISKYPDRRFEEIKF